VLNKLWKRAVWRWQVLPVRWQITVLVVGLIGATLAALGVYLSLSLAGYVEASGVDHLHQLADPIIARETVVRPPRPNSSFAEPPILNRLAFDLAFQMDGPDSFALVMDPSGKTITLGQGPPGVTAPTVPQLTIDPAAVLRATSERREVTLTASNGKDRYLIVITPVFVDDQVIGVAVLGDSLARGDALVHTFQLSLLIGTLLAALAVGFAARELIAAALRPLGRVVEATRRVAAGDWTTRVGRETSPNELGQLAHSFDQMVEQLEEVFEAQRQFVADASHELRTPLTAIGGMLEMLEMNADQGDPATRQRIQVAATREVERLARLVDNLLTLSRIESEGPAPEVVQLDDVVADLRPTLEALTAGHVIDVRLDRVPPVLGQRTRIEQVVINLVENAGKYTPPGGRISLEVRAEADDVVLEIGDTGVGIRPEMLPHIFERFYRADSSRARSSGGFGLGLAIVQAVVETHRGRVDVVSAVGKGTTFTVRLPSVVLDAS
jgi:two-component system OmpR family sensor kinase